MTNQAQRIEKRFLTDLNYNSAPLSKKGLQAVEDYRQRFTIKNSATYDPFMPRNEQRYMHLAKYHKDYLVGDVIDIGSRSSELLERLTGIKAALVDKHNSDLPDWDWEKDPVPTPNKSYDTVICYDTLEHINDFHGGFEDLMRISKKHILISLPNCWRKTWIEFVKGRGRWAGYGLPPEKPIDRHKWFFNAEDAEDFLYYHSSSDKGNYEVVDVKYHIPKTLPRIKILFPILRFILPNHHFKNLFVETMFYVLRKK